MKRIGKALMELLYPDRALCLGCGTLSGCREPWICEECREKLAQSWAGPFPDRRLNGAAAAYRYAGPAGNLVRAFKYRQVKELAPIMAREMARAWSDIADPAIDCVVPVPMHPKRLRKRGFDHAGVLAEALCAEIGASAETLIARTWNTPQMAKLPEEERKGALNGAFAASEAAKGRHILLIDDVYTTGETARTCAKALRRAGAVSVSFVSFAKG